MKTCSRCKVEKDESEFYKDSSHSDGLTSRCKPCKYAPSDSSHGNCKSNRQFADTLANHGIKICSTCKAPKRVTDFYDGEKRCKNCCVKRASAYNRATKNHWPNKEYEAQYLLQEGKCAICHNFFEVLCGDHEHENNHRRGLLCSECNLLLGKSKDNIEVLLSAVDYLRRYALTTTNPWKLPNE